MTDQGTTGDGAAMLSLELHGGEPIRGQLSNGAHELRFSGWLELAGLLEAAHRALNGSTDTQAREAPRDRVRSTPPEDQPHEHDEGNTATADLGCGGGSAPR